MIRSMFNRAARELSVFDELALTERPEHSGPIAEIFYSGRCRRIHKWAHYLPIYERVFSGLRGTSFKMLEIGVCGGGSLDMWREYFGEAALIYGIDIDPECVKLDTEQTPVRIGSQDDPDFLRRVVREMGGLDVVLDDGSHVASHQQTSFETLWPLLRDGGLYVVEDTHTSYWKAYGGGYRKPMTAIEHAKQIIDDMHGWYHANGTKTAARDEVGSVQIFDSIIVIEKQKRPQPGHIIVQPTSR